VYPVAGLDTVQARESNVQENQVGLYFISFANRLYSIGNLGDDSASWILSAASKRRNFAKAQNHRLPSLKSG
jgi:hypothetical protein